MKKGEHAYGGKYWGVGGRWLWIWLSDYRESTVVKKSWQLEIGGWLMGNKIIYSK